MIYYENMCCDCAVPGYPCRGSSCSLRHVPFWKCNFCETDELTEEDMYDDDTCLDCAKKLGYIEEEDDDEEDE